MDSKTITITRVDARRAHGRLTTMTQDGVEIDANVLRAWAQLHGYFLAEPAAHSINADFEIWSPIIEETGNVFASNR